MAQKTECPLCNNWPLNVKFLLKDICPECRETKGRMIKFCNICYDTIDDGDATVCPKCQNEDLWDCFEQPFKLTPKGEKAVNKLQVEALLSEVTNGGD